MSTAATTTTALAPVAAASNAPNPFNAVCGASNQAFVACVTSSLNGFTTAETLCASQRMPGVAISPGANSACLCAAATRITSCYATNCATDATLALAEQAQQAYCKAAAAFGATVTVATVTTGRNGFGTATVAAASAVVTTTSKSVGVSLIVGWVGMFVFLIV
ncbi:hypothetical protein BJ741DRAFT_612126 [Chytriomyces cf. hyalinus JEL632]|nr:hypothetical protein BJ741DRAFT_612126 [Chytriomyces cf. hyalinus JEL632]